MAELDSMPGFAPSKALSLREGSGNPLQYSCLENSMDGGACWATVHGLANSRTRLSNFILFLSIALFGGGNGNPLQCSCLENPMGGRGVMGYSLWGCKESGTTKQLTHIQSSLLLCSETSRKLEDEELHHDSPSWGSLPPPSSDTGRGGFSSSPDSPMFPAGGCSRTGPDGGPGQ